MWAMKEARYCFRHNPKCRERAQKASEKGGRVRVALAEWTPPADLELPIYRGPLGLARAMEDVARMVAEKKMPPTVGNAVVYALSQASRAYRDAAQFQRDEGSESPIVLQHGRRIGSFKLIWSHEPEAGDTRQLAAPKEGDDEDRHLPAS